MSRYSKFARLGLFASAVALAPLGAHAEQFINILTGGTGGVYYPLGVAMSKIYAEKIKDSKPSVQATKASVENLNLLQQGRGEIAFTLGDSLADAWNGNTEVGFKSKLDKLRTVAAIYPNYIQIAALKDSGVKTLADLKGKRLSVGAPRSGTELNARAILSGAGMSYKDLGKVEYLPFNESVELMKNRQLDATLISAGLGVSAIRDLCASVDCVIVEVPKAIVEKIGSPYQSVVIPANTYNGQDKDVQAAAVQNYLVTRAGLPDDEVYQMTKSLFDNLPALQAAHSAAKAISLDTAGKNPPVPLHPGAAKFYKEKGVGG
ncbi:C4-dicarboxylate ABC transporter [Pseudolabrys taiwanensis]|uniref:C4-dicarboxylate ABC transporter n=1 Tax=Pseudolabrys taiwanensis TaxID=331696 RepID=A0A346A1N4_9HYPH|nr:TAXI family TRAP transporter solute-binding subunit [Pseudolabrys taiwanensis]AXK83081.1 C4-dicarboxylate ABC transporter [Pseudolabrys taiwanensis]